jgi:hypothetical protein
MQKIQKTTELTENENCKKDKKIGKVIVKGQHRRKFYQENGIGEHKVAVRKWIQ